jgi:phosphoserine phosphatase
MSSPIVVSDLDGTLSTAEVWRGVLAWAGDRYPSRSARWFVKVRLPAVAVVKAGLIPRERFKARWFHDLAGVLAGLPSERLAEMADWVADEWLWPARRAVAIDAVHAALADATRSDPGARLVVATGAYQQVADAFARRVGADHALGTPLEIVDGRVTGRLAAPVQTGDEKAAAVRAFAGDAAVAAAFGDTGADIPLLRLAQRAVAVAPDDDLRREALRAGWTVLEPG